MRVDIPGILTTRAIQNGRRTIVPYLLFLVANARQFSPSVCTSSDIEYRSKIGSSSLAISEPTLPSNDLKGGGDRWSRSRSGQLLRGILSVLNVKATVIAGNRLLGKFCVLHSGRNRKSVPGTSSSRLRERRRIRR